MFSTEFATYTSYSDFSTANSTIFSTLKSSSNLLTSQPTKAQQVAFIDSRLDNIDSLIETLPNTDIYVIREDSSGVHYISEVLSQYLPEQIDSIHIFSHGTAGVLQLGSSRLSTDELTGYQQELAAWGKANSGDVLLYGCNVAEGDIGINFIEQLAALTGADIQASTDLTGSADLGGNWDLEVSIGEIETSVALSVAGQLGYEGLFSTRTITSDGGENNAAIFVEEGERFITDVESTSNNRFEELRGVFYSFDGGEDVDLLRINRWTGEIKFRFKTNYDSPRDADGNNVYLANVLVTDRDGASDTQALSITVEDKDEGSVAPTITSGNGQQSYFKNVEEGTSYVLDMEASEPDGDTEDGGGITYRGNAGEDADKFRIDRDTGALFFKERPDFENPEDSNGDNIYRLNVLATDSTGQSDSQFIQVRVLNRSGDEPLEVTGDEGETLVAALPNTDPSGRPIESRSLSGPDAARFEIVNHQLQFKNSPNFNHPVDAGRNNIYNLTLTALNNKNIAIVQDVTVTVEEADSLAPVITSDGGGNNATIAVDENTTFVTDVNANSGTNGDTEGNGFVYSFNAGADTDLFHINAQTGVIAFKNAPDFENPADADGNNVYFVNVLLQDSDGQADSQFLAITVENVSETGRTPEITTDSVARVVEGNLFALDIEATDPDGDREGDGLTYRINAGEDRDRFEINTSTGELFFKTQPDFENPTDDDEDNVYRVNVLVTDSTGLVGSQFIQVRVINKVSVYLLGGQSNMAGAQSDADDLTGELANPLPEVKIWRNNRFVDLRAGFNGNFGNGGGFGAELGFGFALEAARADGNADTEEIYLVKYALGSTDLAEDWDINGNNNTYSAFNSWVNGALTNLSSENLAYDIEGMLWMQGENDAFDFSQAANYETNLTHFISDIRTRYGEDTDFLIGRLHDELPNGFTEDEVVRQAQTRVAKASGKNYLINTDNFEISDDSVHFSSQGHLDLGEAFADIFID